MTGIELIRKERKEQIKKHGWSLEHDSNYTNGELVQAAVYAYERVGRGPGFVGRYAWPEEWSEIFEFKIRMKDDIGKLMVAGALFMAENDRLGEQKYKSEIEKIAAEIDFLQALN